MFVDLIGERGHSIRFARLSFSRSGTPARNEKDEQKREKLGLKRKNSFLLFILGLLISAVFRECGRFPLLDVRTCVRTLVRRARQWAVKNQAPKKGRPFSMQPQSFRRRRNFLEP